MAEQIKYTTKDETRYIKKYYRSIIFKHFYHILLAIIILLPFILWAYYYDFLKLFFLVAISVFTFLGLKHSKASKKYNKALKLKRYKTNTITGIYKIYLEEWDAKTNFGTNLTKPSNSYTIGQQQVDIPKEMLDYLYEGEEYTCRIIDPYIEKTGVLPMILSASGKDGLVEPSFNELKKRDKKIPRLILFVAIALLYIIILSADSITNNYSYEEFSQMVEEHSIDVEQISTRSYKNFDELIVDNPPVFTFIKMEKQNVVYLHEKLEEIPSIVRDNNYNYFANKKSEQYVMGYIVDLPQFKFSTIVKGAVDKVEKRLDLVHKLEKEYEDMIFLDQWPKYEELLNNEELLRLKEVKTAQYSIPKEQSYDQNTEEEKDLTSKFWEIEAEILEEMLRKSLNMQVKILSPAIIYISAQGKSNYVNEENARRYRSIILYETAEAILINQFGESSYEGLIIAKNNEHYVVSTDYYEVHKATIEAYQKNKAKYAFYSDFHKVLKIFYMILLALCVILIVSLKAKEAMNPSVAPIKT